MKLGPDVYLMLGVAATASLMMTAHIAKNISWDPEQTTGVPLDDAHNAVITRKADNYSNFLKSYFKGGRTSIFPNNVTISNN